MHYSCPIPGVNVARNFAGRKEFLTIRLGRDQVPVWPVLVRVRVADQEPRVLYRAPLRGKIRLCSVFLLTCSATAVKEV